MRLEVYCSMDTNTLSSNIRSARLRANLSQAELAKILSKSQTTVAAWETGRSQPDASTIRLLCETLDVSADYLLGLTSIYGQSSIPKPERDLYIALNWLLVFSDMGLIIPHFITSDNSEELHEVELKAPLNELLLSYCHMQEAKRLISSSWVDTPDSDEVYQSIELHYQKVFARIAKILKEKTYLYSANLNEKPN